MKRFLLRDCFSVFAILGILFIPFPFHLFPFQVPITDFIFGSLIRFTAQEVFQIPISSTRVYSDFVSMYILVLLLAIFSIILSLCLQWFTIWKQKREQILSVINSVIAAYLTVQLLKYGLDKVFKNQFYLPEPNILFTPLGNVNKDLLYWSSMGTSTFYSVFLGIAEVLAALLLFFRRTRVAGLLLAIFLFINIVAINFAFDISVKLFSLFLLYLSVLLLTPYIRLIWKFFFSGRTATPGLTHQLNILRTKPFVYGFLKSLLAGIIIWESLFPFLESGNWNGDKAMKPLLHGAYKVVAVSTPLDSAKSGLQIKNFFIHKDGYLIFQNEQDQMKDYRLHYDTTGKNLLLTDYNMKQMRVPYQFFPADSILTLQLNINGNENKITGKAIDWTKMPAIQKGFHWTVD